MSRERRARGVPSALRGKTGGRAAPRCTERYTRASRAVQPSLPAAGRLAFADGMRCAVARLMRLWLLTAVVFSLPRPALAQSDAGPALDEARRVMKEGLERDVPAPTPHGKQEWPRPPESRVAPQGSRAEPGARGAEMSERVRNEASLRARAAAEERRAEPDDQPGVGQSRTRAAKAVGPQSPRTKPPKP